jgi:protease-4
MFKKKLLGFLPGGKIIHNLANALNLELEGNGQILWLFKP